MRAGLNRDLVRERTAYRLGRSLVDGFVIAHCLLGILAVIAVLRVAPPDAWANLPEPWLRGLALGGVICAAGVWCGGALLFRELAQALFDVADRALDGAADAPEGENPFR